MREWLKLVPLELAIDWQFKRGAAIHACVPLRSARVVAKATTLDEMSQKPKAFLNSW
jgi:hypothetical protein